MDKIHSFLLREISFSLSYCFVKEKQIFETLSENYGLLHRLLHDLCRVTRLFQFLNNNCCIAFCVKFDMFILFSFLVEMVEYLSVLLLMHTKYHISQTGGGSLICTFRPGDFLRRIVSWNIHRPKYIAAECFTSFQQPYKYFDCAK